MGWHTALESLTLHTDARLGTGDHLRRLEVDEQRVLHLAHQLRTAEEVGRQARHPEQCPERGIGLAQAGDELRQRGGVRRVIAEVFRVQQAQLARDVRVVA